MKSLKFKLTIAVLVLVIVCGIAFAMSPLGKQASYLWQQHRISHQVLPANTVIFTEDPARIATLKKSDYRSKREMWIGQYSTNFPDAWERVSSVGAFKAWMDHTNNEYAGFQVEDTFGFLRTSTNGVKWIVKLSQVNPFQASENRRKACLTQSSFRPAGWKPGDRAINVSFMSEQVLLEPKDIFTLFAPQPDKEDASCVNVPYELNGQSGVLQAIVTDRGYVQFSVHSGPAQLVKWNSL